MTIIPTIAQFDPESFSKEALQTSMIYLLASTKREKERGAAFVSIGKCAIAVGGGIAPYLDGVIGSIREALFAKG